MNRYGRGHPDLIGQVFGKLTVIADAGSAPYKEGHLWLCRCECGKERKAPTKKLRIGDTKMCEDCAGEQRRAKQFRGGRPRRKLRIDTKELERAWASR